MQVGRSLVFSRIMASISAYLGVSAGAHYHIMCKQRVTATDCLAIRLRTSAASRLKIGVHGISRFGASLGFFHATVASAKTANPKIKGLTMH